MSIIDRLLKAVDTWFLQRSVRYLMLLTRYSHHSPLRENDLDLTALDQLDGAIMRQLGVQSKRQLTDQQKLLEQEFGITREVFNAWPVCKLYLPIDADQVLETWLAANEGLSLRARDHFSERGSRQTVSTSVIKGRAIPETFTVITTYLANTHCIRFVRESDRSGSQLWNIRVDGVSADKLLAELQARYDAALIARLRGKTISHDSEILELKLYERDKLVYPRVLGQRIDELVAAFQRWAKPDSKVLRWGSLLIGGPGTGKTTIGGMLAAARPADCTFIYFPAADVRSAHQITRVFQLARKLQPCILQIDDVDLIARDRRSNGDASYTSALMEALDGLEESTRLFAMMTSNDISTMEPAIVDRAGRISSKLVFTGFEEVCGEMIALHAQTFGLTLDRADIDTAVLGLKEQIKGFTPDEAKNICQRLYLLHGEERIPCEALISAIIEAQAAFHSSTAAQSFLPQKTTNGATTSEELD